jgi:RES domain-containing protein
VNLETLAPRSFTSRQLWHQGPTTRPVTSFVSPADYDARWHRVGQGAWYASTSAVGAWSELFRHFSHDGVSPFEVRRRIGRVGVTGLLIWDLTDETTRRALNVTLPELCDDDYAVCQQVADLARAAGVEGLLAPSAADKSARTLVIFPDAMNKVVILSSTIARPPQRWRSVLLRVRRRDELGGASSTT